MSAPAGRALATALLAHVCDWAADRGAYKVQLITGAANPGKLDFYRRASFEDRSGFAGTCETRPRSLSRSHPAGDRAMRFERDQPPLPQPITGDSHDHLIAPLLAHGGQLGYMVEIRDLPDGGPDGWCDPERKQIVATTGAANRQVRTLVHEIATASATASSVSARTVVDRRHRRALSRDQ